jgi:membrane-bound lytic murein transglycosylase D
VRRKNGTPDAAPEEEVDNARLALAPATVLKHVTVRARSGDTIARVAARYDLPAATVAGWNGKSASTPLTRWEPVTLYLPMRTGRGHAVASSARAERRHCGKAAHEGKSRHVAKASGGKKRKKH